MQRELFTNSLSKLAKVRRDGLNPLDALNCAAFEYALKQRLEGLQFPQHLQAVRQLGSLPIELLGSAPGGVNIRLRPSKTTTTFLGGWLNSKSGAGALRCNSSESTERGSSTQRT